MLNPLDLNDLSYSNPDKTPPRQFPLPWHDPGGDGKNPSKNPACENLRGAWEVDRYGAPLPVAIYPTYVHPRLRGQRSCFTIHGKDKRGLDVLLTNQPFLKRYEVDPARRPSMRRELTVLGITDSVVFPDLDGLANSRVYWQPWIMRHLLATRPAARAHRRSLLARIKAAAAALPYERRGNFGPSVLNQGLPRASYFLTLACRMSFSSSRSLVALASLSSFACVLSSCAWVVASCSSAVIPTD
jgi:hypothetical protein